MRTLRQLLAGLLVAGLLLALTLLCAAAAATGWTS
jgi:hypothetical protein